jgi:hypothetical protein
MADAMTSWDCSRGELADALLDRQKKAKKR